MLKVEGGGLLFFFFFNMDKRVNKLWGWEKKNLLQTGGICILAGYCIDVFHGNSSHISFGSN